MTQLDPERLASLTGALKGLSLAFQRVAGAVASAASNFQTLSKHFPLSSEGPHA